MNSENVDRSQQNRKRTAPQPLPASRQIQQTSSTVAAHPQHVSHLSPQVSNQVRSSTGPSTPNHASGSRSAVQATAAVQSQAKSKPSQTAHNQIEPSSTQDPSSIRRTTETSNTTLQSREIQHPHQVSPANVLKKKPPPPFSFTGSPSKPEQKPSEGWYKFRHPESHYPDPVKSWYITRPGNFELKLVPPPSHSTPPQHRPSRRRIEGAVRPVQKPSIAGLLPTMGSSSSHTRWIPGEPGATDLRRSHPLRETTDSRVASSATPSHVQGGKATTGPVPKFRESPKPIPSQSRAKGAASPSQKPSNGGSSSGVVSSSSLTRRMPGEFGATDLRRPHPLKETVDSRAVSSSAEPKHVQGAKATVAIEPVSSLREIPKPIVSSESHTSTKGAGNPPQKSSDGGSSSGVVSSLGPTRRMPGELGATELRRSHPLKETVDPRAVSSSVEPKYSQGDKTTSLIEPVPKSPTPSHPKGPASPSRKSSDGGSSSSVVSSSSLIRRMLGELGATDLRHSLTETIDSGVVSSSAESNHGQGEEATGAIEPVPTSPKPSYIEGPARPSHKSIDGGSSSGVVSSSSLTRRMLQELGATDLQHSLTETIGSGVVSSSAESNHGQGEEATGAIEPVPTSPKPSYIEGPARPSHKSFDGGSSSSVVSSSSLIRRMLGELGATDLRHSLTETIGSGVVSSSAESNHGQGEEATGAIEPVPTSPKPSYIEGPASPSHKSFDGGSSSSVVSSSSLTRRMLGELGPTDLRHSLTETIDSRVVSLSAEPNHGQGGEATGAIRRVLELRESPKPVPVPDPISYPQRPSSEVAEHIGHRTLSLGASTASSGTSRQRQNMQSTASRASAPSVTSAGRARSYQPPVSSTATSKYEKKHESASTTDSAPEITALLDSVSSCEEDEASSVHWDPKGKSKYSSTHWTETSSSSDKETSPVTSSEWPPFDAAFFDHLENSLPSILEPFNKIRALPYVRGSLDDVQSLATIFDTRLSSIMHSLERIPLNIQITTPYQHASEALLFNRRLLVDTIECLEGNYMPGGRVAAEEIEEAFDLVKDLLRSVVDSIKQLLLVSEGLFTENTLLTNSPDPDAASLQGSTEADTLNQGDMSILERAFRYSDRTSDQQNASDDTGSFYSTAYVEGTCQEMASNAGERPWSMAFSNNPSLRDTIYESEAGVNECRSVSLCSIDSIDTSRFSFPEILEYEQAGELQISKQKALEDAFDVKIDGGLLTTASFPALVRFMTSLHEVTTDYEISQLFFLAFRTFATPVELFEELVKRWRSEPPSTVPPAQRHIWKTHSKAVKRQVAKILNLWVQLHWRQETDKDVAKLIVEFAGKLATHSFTSGYISNLQKCAESQHQGGIRREWIARAKKAPSGFTDLSDLRTYSGSVTLLAIRDSDLASQLTILESSLFRSVDPEDYWRQCTGQCVDNQVESKISKVIARNNALSAWASSTVAEEFNSTSTAEVYCKFANVATKCVQLRNYSSAFAIWLSLVSVAVERLIPAQKHSTNTRRQIANLDALFADHSMRIYWKALNESSELAVPILAQFRGRLIRTSVPPDVSLPSGKKGINVLRLRAVCVHLREMEKYYVPYELERIDVIQEFLEMCLDSHKPLPPLPTS